MPANLENSAVTTGLEKVSFHSKAMPKNAQTTTQLHSSHTLVMLRILQARLHQYVKRELPDVQAGFRKGGGPEIKLPASAGSSKKQESSRETSISAFIEYAKAFDCVDDNKLENSERDGNTRPPDLPLEKLVCRSGSNS